MKRIATSAEQNLSNPENSDQNKYLCLVSEIPEFDAKEFELDSGEKIFILKEDNTFFGYINNCPHANWPLNFQPNVFLTLNKSHIQCSNHMALFNKKTGECISGPCSGDQLTKVKLSVYQGTLVVES